MKYLVLILALLAQPAFAQLKMDEPKFVEAIGLHLFSRHDPYRGENQINPGLFIRLQYGITVGTYTNSIQKETNYIGWTSPEAYRFRLSILMATGYKEKGAVLVPVPSLKLYQVDRGPSFWLSGTPFQITDSRAVGHLHMEWKF